VPVEGPSADAEGPWQKCSGCGELNYRRLLERQLGVCPRCGHHQRLPAEQRIAAMVDRGSFRERDRSVKSDDPLAFRDQLPYPARLAAARAATGLREAIVTGVARIGGHPVAMGVFDFGFLGGTMGRAVGERLTRIIEHAAAKRLPLVTFAASGGARMQEGIFSLLQMVKVTGALARLRERRSPFISVLTDPTTGGVAASAGLLGDVNIGEPGALIGFAGPRVVEQTIAQKLPSGFQRAEFLLAHGLLDMVVPRPELRATLSRLLDLLVGPAVAPARRRSRPRRVRSR
jgi:acetyl-CoA carboxylase carboxyl transferase subunit beta